MPAYLNQAHAVVLRKGATQKIKDNTSSLVLPKLVTEETYYPKGDLTTLKTPQCKVVALSVSAERDRETRDPRRAVVLVLPLEIAVQQKVDPNDTDAIDQLMLLVEQIHSLLEDDDLVDGKEYSWSSTEAIADENGLPYSHEQLTIEGVWQAIFRPTYRTVKDLPPEIPE